jgi:hypothetical protein
MSSLPSHEILYTSKPIITTEQLKTLYHLFRNQSYEELFVCDGANSSQLQFFNHSFGDTLFPPAFEHTDEKVYIWIGRQCIPNTKTVQWLALHLNSKYELSFSVIHKDSIAITSLDQVEKQLSSILEKVFVREYEDQDGIVRTEKYMNNKRILDATKNILREIYATAYDGKLIYEIVCSLPGVLQQRVCTTIPFTNL